MKKLLLFLLFSTLAWAQGSYYHGSAWNNGGQPLSYPTVRVCNGIAPSQPLPAYPCSSVATIYTDNTEATIATNPYSGDANGNFSFYGPYGWYVVQISGPGVTPYSYFVLLPADPTAATGGGSNALTASSVTSTTANPAATGFLRMANTDFLCWRNQGNTADECYGVDPNGSLLLPLDIVWANNQSIWFKNTGAVGVRTLWLDASNNANLNAQTGNSINLSVNASPIEIVSSAGVVVANGKTLTINGLVMSNVPEMSVGISGMNQNFGSAWQFMVWQIPKAIVIDNFEMSLLINGAGCTTVPIVSLKDLTTATILSSISVSNATANFNNANVGASVAANDQLAVLVTTLEAGCTSNPADANFVVVYHMQ